MVYWIKSKNYSYLIDDSSEDKKAKSKKESFIKKNFNLKILESVQQQINLRIKQTIFKKNNIDTDSPKNNHKESIRKSKLKHSKDLKVNNIMFLLKKLIRML